MKPLGVSFFEIGTRTDSVSLLPTKNQKKAGLFPKSPAESRTFSGLVETKPSRNKLNTFLEPHGSAPRNGVPTEKMERFTCKKIHQKKQ